MQDQNIDSNMNTPQGNQEPTSATPKPVEDMPKVSISPKHDTLWKFALLFMLGCIIFAIFLAYAGRFPFNFMGTTPPPMMDTVEGRPETMVEPSSEEVVAEDMKKDEATVTDEVMQDINAVEGADVDTDYGRVQIDNLE